MTTPGSVQSPPEDASDLIPWQEGARTLGRLPSVLACGLVAVSAMTNSEAQQAPAEHGWYTAARERMVADQIERRGVRDPQVIAAMRQVPRHLFVPKALRGMSYSDRPLPIGEGQTISQPYVVALMTELLAPTGEEKVLEIGTGSGYHAAVLSRVVGEVYTLEIVPGLGSRAARLLEGLGYDNVHVRIGDGYHGWPDEEPFDAMVLTAAPEEVPPPLIDQLRLGGKIVVPLGGDDQELIVLTKGEQGLRRQRITPVRFVPMTGKAQEDPETP